MAKPKAAERIVPTQEKTERKLMNEEAATSKGKATTPPTSGGKKDKGKRQESQGSLCIFRVLLRETIRRSADCSFHRLFYPAPVGLRVLDQRAKCIPSANRQVFEVFEGKAWTLSSKKEQQKLKERRNEDLRIASRSDIRLLFQCAEP
uniref:Uncharacterized protein n=1 Tax=Solanum tuberosum TaxID=4113 RepID=M1D866_SOLTU